MASKSALNIEFLPPQAPAFDGMSAWAGAENASRSELRERTGIDPVMWDRPCPGHESRCAAFPCGLGESFAFLILLGLDGAGAGRAEIWARRADQIAIVALALGLRDEWFDWRDEPDPATDRSWRVIRQDDNGNRFELARFCDRADADLYARLWDERVGAHKQTVFVSRRSDDG